MSSNERIKETQAPKGIEAVINVEGGSGGKS